MLVEIKMTDICSHHSRKTDPTDSPQHHSMSIGGGDVEVL